MSPTSFSTDLSTVIYSIQYFHTCFGIKCVICSHWMHRYEEQEQLDRQFQKEEERKEEKSIGIDTGENNVKEKVA